MLQIRRSEERGHANHGWLDSWHTFSFADYFDPRFMGVGPLRVINEDRVTPGSGFPTHGHRDMEIISYVLEGELAHRDSTGSSSVLRPGDVQRMSAGSGVRHSEFNHSSTQPVHFLQIWIQPEILGIAPGYEERTFSAAEKRGRLRLIASPDATDGSLRIHQQARLYAGLFDGEERGTMQCASGRLLYAHLARGSLIANGEVLTAGDALLIEAGQLELTHGRQGEILVFDLPSGAPDPL